MTILNKFSLSGKTALVTGSSSGLGLEIARALAEAGAHIWLNGRSEARLESAVQDLQRQNLSVAACAFDIANDVERQNAVTAFGKDSPDILINNVGLRDRRPLSVMTDADVRSLLDVDLIASALLTRDLVAGMKAREFGRIITVTSVAGSIARKGNTIYPAAKMGLTGLMRALAVDYGSFGITSNAIAPGFFATETNREMAAASIKSGSIKLRVPLERWGEPTEIAGAALFLASDAASYVNGHVLTVDGGLSVQM